MLAHDTLYSDEYIKTYWDPVNQTHAVKIQPGGFYYSTQKQLLTTVLGSCIAVCIYDEFSQTGGMNHFMLPRIHHAKSGSEFEHTTEGTARYGTWAMEQLINTMMRHGVKKRNMQFKIFGGGKMFGQDIDIGQQNIDFIFEYMQSEQLNVVAHDVGSNHPRKVNFFTGTGNVQMKRLKNLHNTTIIERDMDYMKKLKTYNEEEEGDVELFDD